MAGLPRSSAVVAPCDCLLLNGSCVVNEAVLTGESVPKSKIGISAMVTAETRHQCLSISEEHNLHRRHMVYGGTKLILHKAGEKLSLKISREEHLKNFDTALADIHSLLS